MKKVVNPASLKSRKTISRQESKAATAMQAPQPKATIKLISQTLPDLPAAPSISNFEFKGMPKQAYSLARYANNDMHWMPASELTGHQFFIIGGWKKKDGSKLYLRLVLDNNQDEPVYVSLPLGDNENRDYLGEQAIAAEKAGVAIGPCVMVPTPVGDDATYYDIQMANQEMSDAIEDDDAPF